MKKRKFSEIDPNLPFHAPSISQTKGAGTDPKTSEFAFFKKLKKDASRGFRSLPLQKDSHLSPKKPESGAYSREKTGDVRVGTKGYSSSRIMEHVPTVRTDSFFSPVGVWNKSGMYSISKTPKDSRDFSDNFKPKQIFSHEGNQHARGEVFSRKRQKLRQRVADALFTETDTLCSTGEDIISMLLSRLFPVSAEENKYEDSNPGKAVNSARYGLPDSQELDDQLKEKYQIPETKLLELESRPYFSDHVLSPTFLRSNERITPCAEFATYLSHNFQPLYSITEPECKPSENPSFSATIKSDVTLGSPFNETANATRYGLRNRELDVQFTEWHQISKRKLLELESSSSFSDHVLSPVFLRSVEAITPHANFPTYPHKFQPLLSITEDKSDFGSRSFIDEDNVTQGFLSNKPENEIFTCNHFNELGKFDREPIPLLMEKDFDCSADETNLPITCKYIKPGVPADLSILGHGKEQILNGALDEYYFSPSSSLLDKPRDFNSVLDSGFLRFREFKFGKYVYEGLDTNFNHTALSLSHNKQHFNVPENCKIDTSCDQDSMLFSPYQHWTGRTVSDTYHHHSNPETWLPSPLDECQRGWSLTSSHLNYRSSSSRTLQLPQRESVSSPSHINDNYKPERYGENHGEVLYHFRENSVEIYNSSFLHMSMQRNNGCAFPLDGRDYVNEQGHTQKLLL